MTADTAGKAELFEESLQTLDILRLVRVDFTVDALEVAVGQDGRSAVTRAADEKGIEVVLFNEPVHVNVGKRLAGVGAPVTQQTGLEVFGLEWLLQQIRPEGVSGSARDRKAIAQLARVY